jgi:CelD/BcsL family acetyltransferase involved in cellulose biosynthesis
LIVAPSQGVRYEWRLVEKERGLEEVANAWRSLHDGASLYARYEWHHAVVTRLLPDRAAAYVQVLDGPRIVAIIPLFHDEAATPLLGRVRAASSGFHAHLPFFDFPVARDAPAAAVALALEQALREVPQQALVWRRLAEGGNALAVVRGLSNPRAGVLPWTRCTVIDTARTYDALLESVSKNLRANLRKAARKLQEAGAMRISRETGLPTDDADARARVRFAYETFLALEGSGWKGEGGTASAIALNASTRAFYAQLIDSASEAFLPEIAILWQGTQPLAAQFSLEVAGMKHVLKVGYDEQAKRLSPGHVLLAHIVEAACASGLQGVNLVIEQPWHDVWRPQRHETYAGVRFRSRARAAVLNAYLAVKPWLRRPTRAPAAPEPDAKV